MTQTSKTGGGQGTNQHQIKGKSTGTNRRKNKPLVPMDKNLMAMATNEWRLAEDKNPEVRQAVAENPNTPPEILAVLAGDEYWAVRAQAISNPNTPHDARVQHCGSNGEQCAKLIERFSNLAPAEEHKLLALQDKAPISPHRAEINKDAADSTPEEDQDSMVWAEVLGPVADGPTGLMSEALNDAMGAVALRKHISAKAYKNLVRPIKDILQDDTLD